MLVHGLVAGQLVVLVDPVGDARQAAGLADHHRGGAVQYLAGVEDGVHLRVLEQPVGVDAGAGGVELAAHEGRHHRDVIADLVVEIPGDVGDGGGVHAVQAAAQAGVLHHHGLQRDVAGALADAQQRAVHRAGAVQPRRGGVGHGLVEVVVAVPLQHLAGHVGIVLQAVDDAGHAAGQGHLGIRHAIAHRVAGANLHGNARVLAHLHQLVHEGHHEAVEVRPGDVLQVAAGHDPGLKGVRDGLQVVFHALLAAHLHLLEDVVVAAGHQNARLADAQVLHQLEVLPGGADPGGDLREAIAQVHALLDGLAVLLAVDEELRLADHAVGAAQPGHQLVKVHDLLDRVGLHGLLAVPKGRVGDPDVLRHAHGHAPVVEGDAGNLVVGVDVPVQIRVRDILQRILVLALLQQIGLRGHFQHRFHLPWVRCARRRFVSLYTRIHALSSTGIQS